MPSDDDILDLLVGPATLGGSHVTFETIRPDLARRCDRPRRMEEPMIQARELRFVVVTDDHDAAVHLYRDVFGLEVMMDLDDQGGRGIILNLPAATLELVDAEHDGMVNELEVGRRLDNRIRIAVKVDALADASRAVAATGAEPMADPVETPWGDRNQRFRAKDGLQLTLFQSR